MNLIGGKHYTALQVAYALRPTLDNPAILKHGANIDADKEHLCASLQAAISKGLTAVVNVLLYEADKRWDCIDRSVLIARLTTQKSKQQVARRSPGLICQTPQQQMRHWETCQQSKSYRSKSGLHHRPTAQQQHTPSLTLCTSAFAGELRVMRHAISSLGHRGFETKARVRRNYERASFCRWCNSCGLVRARKT